MTYYFEIEDKCDKPEFWQELSKLSDGRFAKEKIANKINLFYSKDMLDTLPPFYGKCVRVAVHDKDFLYVAAKAAEILGLERIMYNQYGYSKIDDFYEDVDTWHPYEEHIPTVSAIGDIYNAQE